MSAKPELLRTPKSYWATRRSEGHTDWAFGFWRELFQNEVDAGATRIDITVAEAPGKGSFGREATVDKVARVTFQGDGAGMDERVLREVFLRPGETTKKGGDFQGGFGTARIMLCFSQVRYSVRTRDWIVEGDGSEYTCMTISDALAAARGALAEAEAETNRALIAQMRADLARQASRDQLEAAVVRRDNPAAEEHHAAMTAEAIRQDAAASDGERSYVSVQRLRADLAALEADSGHLDGCRFEIDVDPNEFPNSSYRNVGTDKLLAKLGEYLGMSQIVPKVFVNGEEATARTLKGPVRRTLVATGEDGREVVFASVHTSQGEKARHKGKVVVRSGGAAMYLDGVEVKEQVVVELDPGLSRQVLTDNRDGMKSPYREALSAFLRELAVDTRTALEDKENRKHIKIEGGKGPIVVRNAPAPVAVGVGGALVEVAGKAPKARYSTPEHYEVHGYGGASARAVDRLIEAVGNGDATFLDRLASVEPELCDEIAAFRQAVWNGRGAAALTALGAQAGALVAATLAVRETEAQSAVREMEASRYADMHDVHIHVEDVDGDEKLKNAVRRFSPGYWRRKGEALEGRGMQAHMLLAAWTSCCEEAVATLLALHPKAGKDGLLKIATGFHFEKPEKRWDGTMRGKGAIYQKRDDTHVLLLNPVDFEGQMAYDLTLPRRQGLKGPGGIQNIEALACHEVAHIMESYHDEDYAGLLTDLMGAFDRARAHERMRDAVDAVRAAYGRGVSRIQAMDGEETVAVAVAEEAAPAKPRRREPRPSEVLLAHAAPITTILAGAVSAPENQPVPAEALREHIEILSSTDADLPGSSPVVVVDCDRLQSMEARLGAMASAGWNLDALELPALADLAELGTPDTPMSTPHTLHLATLDIPAPDELPELAAPVPQGDAALADEPFPARLRIKRPTPVASTNPVEANRRAPTHAAPEPAASSAMEMLAQMSGSLSPLPRPAPARDLVGEDFEMDGFDDVQAPRF